LSDLKVLGGHTRVFSDADDCQGPHAYLPRSTVIE
jgi:hypothetical protein